MNATPLTLAALTACLLLAGCPRRQPPAQPPPAPPPSAKAPPAEAETKAPPRAITVVLTKDLVTRWIASMQDPKVKAILEKERKAAEAAEPSASQGPAGLREDIEARAKIPELNQAVKAHGFTDAQQWTDVTLKVFSGWMVSVKGRVVTTFDRKSPEYRQASGDAEKEKAQTYQALAPLTEQEQKLIDSMLTEIGSISRGGRK
jgi:hypothetical protein